MGILKDLAKGKSVLVVYPNEANLDVRGTELVMSTPEVAVYHKATWQVRVKGGGVAHLYRPKDMDVHEMAGLQFQSIYLSRKVHDDVNPGLPTGTLMWLLSRLRGTEDETLKLVYMKAD